LKKKHYPWTDLTNRNTPTRELFINSNVQCLSLSFELEPVVTIALAVVVLEESLTISKILGGIMVLVAVVLLARSEACA
jgi:drug/metabolite transporter (DMT)-like permease